MNLIQTTRLMGGTGKTLIDTHIQRSAPSPKRHRYLDCNARVLRHRAALIEQARKES